MFISHKIRLYPNNKQKTLLAKSAGTARFVYNWALAEWDRQYKEGEKTNEAKLRKQLNDIKKEQFPWMREVSQRCTLIPIQNLGNAFKKFFNGLTEYPRFKKKSVNDCYTLDYNNGCNFEVRGKKIRLQKIGKIRLAEQLRFDGKLLWVTISRKANRWFASIRVEITNTPTLQPTNKSIGVDVGVREYADSNSRSNSVPMAYRKVERKLRKLQQSLSRKQKDSKNREKANVKVAQQHAKIRNIRQDWLHKLTTNIIKNNDIIGIEDLNVKGMVKNKRLAKSISDASFGEFRKQLQYKSEWYGRTLVLAPRFYPPSKICSSCQVKTKRKLELHIREWTCGHCGTKHHRDVNAAINLRNYAVGFTVSACGEFSASDSSTCSSAVKQPRNTRKRKKQEAYTNT